MKKMARDKFLLVSLSESKAKELAQAITNETCRKILDYLADKEATESDLAASLSIPISTVHYNLQQLQKAGLVEAEEFHYSEKGREVNHYKLANKYVIIAPKTTFGIKEKLKSILPAIGIIGLGAAAIHFVSRNIAPVAQRAIESEADEAVLAAAPKAAELAQETAPEAVNTIIQASPQNIALWFLIGASAALLTYLLIEYIRKRD